MRRSSGHRGVHPYHAAVFQSIPRRVAGQPFQQWLALTRTARGLPASDSSGVDVSVPDIVELDAGAIGVGQALLEMMFISSLCWVHRLRLMHKLARRSVVQMANPGLDPVNAAKFHVADMLQWSRLLTGTETPPHIPHPASRPIDFRVRAIGLQIATDTSFDPTDPDHINNAADQLRTLSSS